MRIFITGSTGFLGKAILHYLPQYDYYCYKRGDDVTKLLQSFAPDVIIHSAGEIYNEETMFNSNVILTLDILNYVKQHDIKKMIYFGSSSEYGKTEYAMQEIDVCNPQTLYAATKTCGTVLCQAYARTYDKDICVVRPFSVYGPFEPSHRLIPTLYRKILKDEQVDLIKGYHDFIYIEDFVEIVKTLLYADKTISKADVINAGSGVEYSNLEVAVMFSIVLSKKLQYNLLDKVKQCDSHTWIADTNHLNNTYNLKTKFSLEDGLKAYKLYMNERFTKID